MAKFMLKSPLLRAYYKTDKHGIPTNLAGKFHAMKYLETATPAADVVFAQSVCNKLFSPKESKFWTYAHIEDLKAHELCEKCFAGFDIED
jgi:hypothetical protein